METVITIVIAWRWHVRCLHDRCILFTIDTDQRLHSLRRLASTLNSLDPSLGAVTYSFDNFLPELKEEDILVGLEVDEAMEVDDVNAVEGKLQMMEQRLTRLETKVTCTVTPLLREHH